MSPEPPHGPGPEGGRLELALRLSCLVLILDGSLFWFQRLPVLALATLGLLLPRALFSRSLWVGLVVLVSWPLVWNWPFSDNHDYLRAFWCGAVLVSLCSPTSERMLAWNGRLLIGLTFLFATLWKLLLSPDFVDGTFFRVTLLTDGRFQELAILAGGLDFAGLEAFDAAMARFLGQEAAWPAAGFVEPPALRRLALALTGFTLLSEAAVALCFLWPRGRGPSRWRDPVLLAFALSTYAFATVRGFGWLLMTLGLAQTDPAAHRTRLAYVVAVVMIEVYRSVPWSRMLIEGLGLG